MFLSRINITRRFVKRKNLELSTTHAFEFHQNNNTVTLTFTTQRPAGRLELWKSLFSSEELLDLLGSPGNGGGAGQAWLSLLSDTSEQLLDLGDGSAGVEALGAGLGAVHDGVASVTNHECYNNHLFC